MAKYCPVRDRKVLYMECLECDEKICNLKVPTITINTSGIQDAIENKQKMLKDSPSAFLNTYIKDKYCIKESFNKDKEYLQSLLDEQNYSILEKELSTRIAKLNTAEIEKDKEDNSLFLTKYADYLLTLNSVLTNIFKIEHFMDYINKCSPSKIIIICKLIIKASTGSYSPDDISENNPLEAEKFEIINDLISLGVFIIAKPSTYRYLHLTEFGKESYEKNKTIINFLGS